MRELLVTWEHPETGIRWSIGILAFDGHTYTFDYLPQARRIDGFRPLLTFPDLRAHYEASSLFPFFHERVMDPKRPDFVRWLDGLGLDPASATPWEQLVHSSGSSQGDTIQLRPMAAADLDTHDCD